MNTLVGRARAASDAALRARVLGGNRNAGRNQAAPVRRARTYQAP